MTPAQWEQHNAVKIKYTDKTGRPARLNKYFIPRDFHKYSFSLVAQLDTVLLTYGPHIAAFVIPTADDLGRDRVRRPDRLVMHLPEREMLAQAKIDHDQLAVSVHIPEQKVLQLVLKGEMHHDQDKSK